MRPLPLILIALAGCTALDRDSYSLVIRKKCHRYRPMPPEERKTAPEPVLEPVGAQEDEDRFPPPVTRRGEDQQRKRLADEAFVPFAYCYYHRSSHHAESVEALAAAPLEYPLAVTTYMAAIAVRDIGVTFADFWNWLFPSPRKEPPAADSSHR